jgi:methionine biosynthesis protein MetW
MLGELLRIGRLAFVSFPNFAYWRMRVSLLAKGRMPVTRHLPVSWYETQNIHHVTVEDFRELLRAQDVHVKGAWYFTGGREIGGQGANWRAEHAVFQLSR